MRSSSREFASPVSSRFDGRVLRLPITHLHEEMPAILSKLERCSGLLVIQRRALGTRRN
jgi:hypothetical protein